MRQNRKLDDICKHLYPHLPIAEALQEYEKKRRASVGTKHQLPADIVKYHRYIMRQKGREGLKVKVKERRMEKAKLQAKQGNPENTENLNLNLQPVKPPKRSRKAKKKLDGRVEAWRYQLVPRESTRRAIIAEFLAKNNGEEVGYLILNSTFP